MPPLQQWGGIRLGVAGTEHPAGLCVSGILITKEAAQSGKTATEQLWGKFIGGEFGPSLCHTWK